MLFGKKVRLQPNKEQTNDFCRFAGTNRFSWNESLAFYESVSILYIALSINFCERSSSPTIGSK